MVRKRENLHVARMSQIRKAAKRRQQLQRGSMDRIKHTKVGDDLGPDTVQLGVTVEGPHWGTDGGHNRA